MRRKLGQTNVSVIAGAVSLPCLAACGSLGEGETTDSLRDDVIWNSDSRIQYYEGTTTQKAWANATALIGPRPEITCDDVECVLSIYASNLCPSEKYHDELTAVNRECTVFRVGPRQFVTAEHCILNDQGADECPLSRIAFGWRRTSALNAANNRVPRNAVYDCSRLLFSGDWIASQNAADDWAVFEVDRDIVSASATPLKLVRDASLGTRFTTIGHPRGLPTKLDPQSTIPRLGVSLNSAFTYEADVMEGSSGGPLIDNASGRVAALVSTGVATTTPDGGACFVNPDCPGPNCSDGFAAPASAIPEGPRSFFHQSQTIGSGFLPTVGDFDKNGADDVLWFKSGAAADEVWWGQSNRQFQRATLSFNGAFGRGRAGDFDGDGASDVLFHSVNTSEIRYGNANRTFTLVSHAAQASGTPMIGDFDGDGRSDVIFWEASPGAVWFGAANRTFERRAEATPAAMSAFVGDFNGDRRDDIYWFRHNDVDLMWWGTGTRSSPFAKANGPARDGFPPLGVGDFNGDGRADLVFWRPGAVFWGTRDGRFVTTAEAAPTGRAVIGDYDSDGKSDILWYGQGAQPDAISFGRRINHIGGLPGGFDNNVTLNITNFVDNILVGDFNGDTLSDIVWYGGSHVTTVQWWKNWFDG